VWDEYDEIYRATVMNWYIHKNDDMQRDQKVDLPFFKQLSLNPNASDYHTSYELMMCGSDAAPTHPVSSKLEPTVAKKSV
jgi:hypothetical protein